MPSRSAIKRNMKNAMEYMRKHPVLDAAARSLLEEIPVVGGFLVKIYENAAGSDEDKSQKILQFLSNLEQHEKEEFNRISKFIECNHDLLIKSVIENRIAVSDLISKSFTEVLTAIQSSERQLIERLTELVDSKRSGYQVSYMIIEIKNDNIIETLSKLASALNVQLIQNDQEITFVPFDGFDSIQHGRNLFLYGRSGSGKSRTMLEVMRAHLTNHKRIYLINPSKVLGEGAFREDISHLAAKFKDNDAVIWDNFPLDLPYRNPDGARKALEIVSLTRANKVIVSLNPTYPEAYRKIPLDLPEMSTREIIFTKENMKNIVEAYGTRIDLFQEVYQQYVQKSIERISTILWKKEPTPLIVFEYYKQLSIKRRKLSDGLSSGVNEAEQLYPMTTFYENQFKYLRQFQHENHILHFLYALKLCYDLGLARNLDLLHQLQESIFHSRIPTEPTQELSSWIYLSGSYYSMHDIAKEAIKFSPDILLKIIGYLKKNPDVMLGDDNTLYLAGVFIGKNLHYLISGNYPYPLPEKFGVLTRRGEEHQLKMKELAEEYHSNDDMDFQKRLIEVSNNYRDPFGHGAGYGLAQLFLSLDQVEREKIWRGLMQLLTKNPKVGFGFGEGIAQILPSLKQEDREKFWNRLMHLRLENGDFASGNGEGIAQIFDGLSEGIAQVFDSISKKDFQNIAILVTKHHEFAAPLGMFSARKLQTSQHDIQLQERMMELIRKSSSFAAGIGSILSDSFLELDKSLQEIFLKEAKQNHSLDIALGFGKCQFCTGILKNDYKSFERHMFQNHYDILRQQIPNIDAVPQECEKCGEIITSDLHEIMKHRGEKHYASLPQDMKKWYDEWKARGYPKITDYDDCYE
jgi:hypothetical protein